MPPFAGCGRRLGTRRTCRGLSRRCPAAAIGSSLRSAGSRNPRNQSRWFPRSRTKPFRHLRSRRPRDRFVPGARCESPAWPWCSRVVLWAWGAFPTYPAPQSPPATDRFMLAVLPFQNMTGDPAQEYISDGMTEELISQLGRLDPSRLGVIARTSVMRFKNTTNAADRIASDLGVSYLLEGSVRTTTDRIGITVRLIETETASQLWAGQYERDVQNLLTLQREVAEAIAGQITTSLGVTRSNRQCRRPAAFSHPRGLRALPPRALSPAPGTRPTESTRRWSTFREPSTSTRPMPSPTVAWLTPLPPWATAGSGR